MVELSTATDNHCPCCKRKLKPTRLKKIAENTRYTIYECRSCHEWVKVSK